ncbi:hypothetical protein MESS2_730171 [Mesorhizobium metallidurans STM 2683]|uniref:Uncharacterized protein n=1 Tax=Mesorhizobium metallidurans STM 2683 TaxID=1297569 RepID=M5EWB6_9HYPH|nr:hypothetical protein MESS2_730171 [Mesorhizobium metallidurans STM 2683]
MVASSVQRIPPESIDPRLKNFHWLDLTMGIFEAYDKDATVAGETPARLAICLPVKRWRRSATMRSVTAWPVAFGLRLGRDERSAMPARPSALVALDPPLHDLRRHRVLQRRLGLGKPAFYNRKRHLLSTQRREAGILVDVRSDPPVSAEAW